ncbi:hypothetical protein A0128_02935 [Leptospira tipperaryensis]|uniref:Uncharacterized protein n=1 Tax=Leptospira tipperaryensis TaxID=2564040 RepID=A0A1D7UTL3_9LEPT|nr:hypothetical protein A0128_02935 [Leptospira tipperaryensis]
MSFSLENLLNQICNLLEMNTIHIGEVVFQNAIEVQNKFYVSIPIKTGNRSVLTLIFFLQKYSLFRICLDFQDKPFFF